VSNYLLVKLTYLMIMMTMMMT